MTNEEIKKRFEFDLKIGLFREDILGYGKNNVVTFYDYYRNSTKLLKLLIDCGFLFSKPPTQLNLPDPDIVECTTAKDLLFKITIKPTDKLILDTHWILRQPFSSNPLPEFVKDYEIPKNFNFETLIQKSSD